MPSRNPMSPDGVSWFFKTRAHIHLLGMVNFLLAYMFLLFSSVAVATMRMAAWSSNFTYKSMGFHLGAQAAIAALCLWISALFGPLDAGVVATTALMLLMEAVFRVLFRIRRGS